MSSWKEIVAERRARPPVNRLAPQNSVLPASRRRFALLQHIREIDDRGERPFGVNAIHEVPYTDDMRWLVARGLLVMKRDRDWPARQGFSRHSSEKRVSYLRITDAGRTALAANPPTARDMDWLFAAKQNRMLR